MTGGWIGVDLDGTLAQYNGDVSIVGDPIEPMADRVRQWLKEGKDVRIVTARVAHLWFTPSRAESQYNAGPTLMVYHPTELEVEHYRFSVEQKAIIERWCEHHLGKKLPVTAVKDYAMIELWDDRAVACDYKGRACRMSLNGEPEQIHP